MTWITDNKGLRTCATLCVVALALLIGRHASAAVLPPGTITTCGELAAAGTYTLGTNIGSGGACITITSNGAILAGAGHTLTGNVTGNGVSSGDPGFDFSLGNITITGTTTSNGANSGGDCNLQAGSGGSISISSSTVHVVQANGGAQTAISGSGCTPMGAGGAISITATALNLSNASISAAGGTADGEATDGTLTLNYTSFAHASLLLSAFTHVVLNGPSSQPGDLGSFPGGLFPDTLPGATIMSSGACDLAFSGTYTLGANIGDCTIRGNGVILDGGNNGAGGHFQANGNVSGSAASAGGAGYSFTLQHIKVLGSVTANGNGNAGGSITILYATTSAVSATGGAGVINVSTSTTGSLNDPAGTITVYQSTVGAISANGGGTVTITESTSSDVSAMGAADSSSSGGSVTIATSSVGVIDVSGYGDGQGTGGNGGTVTSVASAVSTIRALGGDGVLDISNSPGAGGTVNIAADSLNLAGLVVNVSAGQRNIDAVFSQLPLSSALYGYVNLTYSSVVSNTVAYFYYVQDLVANGQHLGRWNGAFNSSGLYFNDQVSGAGHNGDWNTLANWWADAGFTQSAAQRPIAANDVAIYTDVTQNLGAAAAARTVAFYRGAKNRISITATSGIAFYATSTNYGTTTGPTSFNDSSANYGTTTGQTTFVGNLSENHGSVSNDSFTAVGPAKNWTGIASSADGSKLAAVDDGGYIYTSTDNGATWTARASSRLWVGITSSADGAKLAAVVANGQIYVSSDSGATWTARGPSKNWKSIAISADGSRLAAVAASSQVYVSSDYGATWTAEDSSRNWIGIASSADGSKLAATVNGGQIYTSTDSGATWTARDSSRSWVGIASSADGTKLAAVVASGRLYTSADSGVTWTPRDSSRSWWGVTSSSDGARLAAVLSLGKIYTSTDSGATWTAHDSSRSWTGIASSADGKQLAAVGALTNIFIFSNTDYFNTPIRRYEADINVGTRDFASTGTNWVVQAVGARVNLSTATYDTTHDFFQTISGGTFVTNPSINGGAAVVPEVTVTSPVAGTVTKWQPSVSWGNSVTCKYSYNNFSTQVSADCSGTGSEIARPSSAGTTTLYLKGIDSNSSSFTTSVTFYYDNVSPIYTACGSDLLDEPTRQYYYLLGDVTGDCVATVDAELRGSASSTETGHTVNGSFSAATSGAGKTVSLKNITVTGTVSANGAPGWLDPTSDVPGFPAGRITIATSTTGNIHADGGAGAFRGGSGGTISVTNSIGIAGASTTVSAVGGNARDTCSNGGGGPGGSVSLVNSTYGAVSVAGGSCPGAASGSFGSGGGAGSQNVVGAYEAPPQKAPNIPVSEAAPALSAAPSPASSESFGTPVEGVPGTEPIPQSIIPRVGQAVAAVTQQVADTAVAVASSPVGATIQAAGFFAGLVASVSSFAGTAAPIAASEILFTPLRLWGILLAGLGIRKRVRPWGTVYDSVTKQPIDPAIITVKDMSGETVAEAITDLDGRYGFLLPPGQYYISARKTNYEFPSRKLEGNGRDEVYGNLYFGAPISVAAGQVIDRDIPMDQIGFDWNEAAKRDTRALSFHSRHEKGWARLNTYICGAGFAVSFIVATSHRTVYSVIMLALYAAVITFMNFGGKKKRLGKVVDRATGEPLSYALVKVTGPDRQVVLRTAVADAEGRYYCIVPKGQYYVEVDRKNPDGSYSKAYESGLISSDTGALNSDFSA